MMDQKQTERNNELARKIRAGNNSARDVFITENMPLVSHLASEYKQLGGAARRLFNEEELVSAGLLALVEVAEELKQVDIKESATSFTSKAIKRAFSETVSFHKSVVRVPRSSERRKKEKGQKLPSRIEMPTEIPDTRPLEMDLSDALVFERISKACTDDSDRKIVELRKDKLTYEEIASRLGCDLSTVRRKKNAIYARYNELTISA